MMRRTLLSAMLAALAALAVAHPAQAGEPTEQLKLDIARVFRALEAPARREAVRAVSRDLFDWSEMARRSLGRHWHALTESEQEEFTGLLGRLVDARLITLAGYRADGIEYLGEAVDGETALVRTTIAMTYGRAMSLDYRMLRRGERWLIYDVVLDGASMVGNYRAQFTHIMKTASYEQLIQKLATQ